jgi:HAD superfamily hydrolase (TIGR01509 family)
LKTPKAVLFDMDGVLVQTEPLKAQAHASTVAHFGGKVEPAFYATVMGQSMEAAEWAFCQTGQVEEAFSRYRPRYETIYHTLLQTQLAVTPGVIPLLQQLQGRGYRLAVVTSDHAATMQDVLARTSLIHFFEVRVARDDVTRTKPAPDGYLLALERLALPTSAALVIEDSEAGVQAATSAGLPTIALRHSFNAQHDFGRAFKVIDSFGDPDLLIKTIEQALI